MTINQIAEKLNISRADAQAFVTFAKAKGLLLKTGDARVPGQKGKPAAVYSLSESASADLATVLAALAEPAVTAEA